MVLLLLDGIVLLALGAVWTKKNFINLLVKMILFTLGAISLVKYFTT